MNATIELLKVKADLSSDADKNLIKEREVIDLLWNEFPEINSEFEQTGNAGTIYKAIQCFTDFTKQLIRRGNFKEVKHSFIVAEKMLQNGNSTVRNAIENVYLFSISSIIDMAGPVSQTVKGLLTESLKKNIASRFTQAVYNWIEVNE